MGITLEKYDSISRKKISSEESHLNQRINWLMALQGLLFATLGSMWDEKNIASLVLVMAVGIFSSFSIGYSLYQANKAIEKISKEWKSFLGDAYKKYPSLEGLDSNQIEFIWLMPDIFLPIIFILAWSFLFFIIIDNELVKSIIHCIMQYFTY